MNFDNMEVTIAHSLSSDTSLSGGLIALIVIAVLLVVVGLGCVAFACMKKKRAKETHYATLYEKALEQDTPDYAWAPQLQQSKIALNLIHHS